MLGNAYGKDGFTDSRLCAVSIGNRVVGNTYAVIV
jgi:hypothetical protein